MNGAGSPANSGLLTDHGKPHRRDAAFGNGDASFSISIYPASAGKLTEHQDVLAHRQSRGQHTRIGPDRPRDRVTIDQQTEGEVLDVRSRRDHAHRHRPRPWRYGRRWRRTCADPHGDADHGCQPVFPHRSDEDSRNGEDLTSFAGCRRASPLTSTAGFGSTETPAARTAII